MSYNERSVIQIEYNWQFVVSDNQFCHKVSSIYRKSFDLQIKPKQEEMSQFPA